MPECKCNVATNRIGEILAPSGEIIFRFALECPAHGIKDVTEKGDADVGNAQPAENAGEVDRRPRAGA